MTVEAITVFRAGAFTTEPAPDWLQRVKAIAEGETHDWYRAIGKVLGDDGSVTEIEDHGGVAVQVNEWPTPGDGRYVEFSDVLRVIAEVWIPEPADWIPFYSGHIIPFLRTHAEMATAGQLDRIGNCLIAFARHGEGQHIKRDCGRSRIDINHDRDFMRRASRASAGPGSPAAPTNERLCGYRSGRAASRVPLPATRIFWRCAGRLGARRAWSPFGPRTCATTGRAKR